MARYLNAPATLEWVTSLLPDQAEKFKAVNPTQLILMMVGSNFWRMDADFRMMTFLPFNEVMELPLADYVNISRWNKSLDAMPV